MSLGMSRTMVGVERVAGGRVARPQSLAVAGAAGGDVVCRRSAHRDHLAAGRRRQRRLTKTIITSWPPSDARPNRSPRSWLVLVLRTLPLPERLLLVIDDSPTKRYGPKVEGADVHHNPRRARPISRILYGHIWVTISLAVRHPQWGALGVAAAGHAVRPPARRIATIPRWRRWGRFATKLQLAARLVEWIVPLVEKAGENGLDRRRRRLHQAALPAARLEARA